MWNIRKTCNSLRSIITREICTTYNRVRSTWNLISSFYKLSDGTKDIESGFLKDLITNYYTTNRSHCVNFEWFHNVKRVRGSGRNKDSIKKKREKDKEKGRKKKENYNVYGLYGLLYVLFPFFPNFCTEYTSSNRWE